MGDATRRRVLQSILAAPALAGLAPALRASSEDDSYIASAAEALDVFDFERLACAKPPPAHWGYLKTGVKSPLRTARRGISDADCVPSVDVSAGTDRKTRSRLANTDYSAR